MIRHFLLSIRYSSRKPFLYFYCLFFSLFILRQILTYTNGRDYLLSTMNYPTNFFSVLTGLNLFLVAPYHLFFHQEFPMEITKYTRKAYAKKVWLQNIGISVLLVAVTEGFSLIGLFAGRNWFVESTVTVYDSTFNLFSIGEIALMTFLILFVWLTFLNQVICLCTLRYSVAIGLLVAIGTDVAGMSLLVLPGNVSQWLFKIFFLKLEGGLGILPSLSSMIYVITFWLLCNGALSILICQTIVSMDVLAKVKRERDFGLTIKHAIYEMKEWILPAWIGQGISFLLILLMKGNGDFIEILDNLLQVSFKKRIVSYAVYYVPILLFLYKMTDYIYRMDREIGIYFKTRKGNQAFERELHQNLYEYSILFTCIAMMLTVILYLIFQEKFDSWNFLLKLLLSLFLSMEVLLTTVKRGMLIGVFSSLFATVISQWIPLWVILLLWIGITYINNIEKKQNGKKEKIIYEMHR